MSRIVATDKEISTYRDLKKFDDNEIVEKKNTYIDKLSTYINGHRNMRFIIDVIVVTIYVAFIAASIGFWLEGNDDNTFAYIVSGHITEKPVPYLYFSNIVWGAIVSALYRVMPDVAWYGVIQFTLIFLMLLFSLHSFEQRCKSFISYCSVMITGIVTMLLAIKMLAFVQFTTLSALLAIAGYVCLIMYEKRSYKLVGFIIFEIIANLIRKESMMMIQPMGYTCFVAVSIIEAFSSETKRVNKDTIKAILQKCGIVFAVVITTVGVFRFTDYLAYSDIEWRNAMIVDEFRHKVNDVYYIPDYEEIKYILDKYDIDEYEYEAMKSTRIFENAKFVEPAKEIVDYLEKKDASKRNELSVLGMLKWTFDKSYIGHWETIILTLLIIILLVLSDKPITFFPFLLFVVGKVFTFGYIYYGQRIVDRVMDPLYYSELIFLLGMVCIASQMLYNKQGSKRKAVRIGLSSVLVTYMLISARNCRNLIIHSREQAEGYRVWNVVSNEVADYCESRSEEGFLISGEITIYWKYPLISKGYSSKGNYTFLGGWFCTAPTAQDYIEDITASDNCYLVLTVDPIYDEANSDILKYCEEYFGVPPKFDEVINTSIGEYAKVYKIK